MTRAWEGLPVVDSVGDLESFGTPEPAVRDKVLPALTTEHREWVSATPLVFVATSSPDGRCDVSPKGDPPGSILVLDETTLVLPERAGNKRMDGFHNLLANPHVGLLMVIPGRSDTLRVNGEARLVSDGPFFDDLTVRGHLPALALVVHVEEVFFHCPKAFMRSKTWKPETWEPDAVLGYAELAKRLWRGDRTDADIETHYASEVYEQGLYPRT